jgi:hypothetical protein
MIKEEPKEASFEEINHEESQPQISKETKTPTTTSITDKVLNKPGIIESGGDH